MESSYITCKIENHTDRTKTADIPRLRVDMGSVHTWVSATILQQIGTIKEKAQTFIRPNGQTITRDVGFAILRVANSFTIDEVVFAELGDIPVLGARTIHGLQLPVEIVQNETSTPSVLYKYYAFNEWTDNIFERNEIYFQSADGFNDPFDSKPSATYEGASEQRLERLIQAWRKGPAKNKTGEDLRPQALECMKDCQDVTLMLRTVERSAERTRRQIGIFCMTGEKANLLMWAHYADAHTGFCLGFKTDNPFFGRAYPVNYTRDRPCQNLIEPLDHEKVADDLFKKSEDWRYENEWRIDDHVKGPGVHQYPAKALSEVILGCRIAPTNRHRIMQWCRKRRPRPNIYWAEEKWKEFGLNIIFLPWVKENRRRPS